MSVASPLLDKNHLPSLDGMRFVAVLMVMLYHGGINVPSADGVTFFFVLSGFLFAWLLGKEWRATGTISLRSFYFRRTMRIVPALYVCLLVSATSERSPIPCTSTIIGAWPLVIV